MRDLLSCRNRGRGPLLRVCLAGAGAHYARDGFPIGVSIAVGAHHMRDLLSCRNRGRGLLLLGFLADAGAHRIRECFSHRYFY